MKKTSLRTLGFVAALTCMAVQSSHGGTSPPSTAPATLSPTAPFGATVMLNSDSFFGFVPSFTGYYNLTDSLAVTSYGNFWSAGTLDSRFGNWNEFGLGLNYKLTNYLSFNPQIGIVSGGLLSGNGAGTELSDGWVPNFTLNLASPTWEGQVYFGAYLPTGARGATSASFLHFWANAGYRVNEVMSFGMHAEQLSGGADLTTDIGDAVYTWVGPYVQFRNADKGLFVRFTGGWDSAANGNGSFYKMTVGFTF
jgi:hypothetical protein